MLTQFHLFVLSDLDSMSMPPTFQYAPGMDLVFRARALQHLKEMVRQNGARPSNAFRHLMGLHLYLASSSEESSPEDSEEEIGWPASSDSSTDSDSASNACDDTDMSSEEEEQHRRITLPRAARNQY